MIMSEQESKALHEFTKVLHNSTTSKHYMSHLRKYQRWSPCMSYDELVNRDIDSIQEELEKYVEVMQNEEGHHKSYMKLAFAGITLFYGMNNKIINKIRIQKMIRPDEQIIQLQAYTTEDIRKILSAINKNKLRKHPRYILTRPRLRAAVHFLAASGCRIGGMTSLKVSDLEKIEGCYFARFHSGSTYEYVSFLTPQATEVLDEWLEVMEKHVRYREELDFEDYPLFDLSHFTLYDALWRLVRKANIEYEKIGPRYPKPLNHAYRYRFNTIAKTNKDVNPILAERLLGHSTSISLDRHYLKPTTETLFKEYKKLVKELTIK